MAQLELSDSRSRAVPVCARFLCWRWLCNVTGRGRVSVSARPFLGRPALIVCRTAEFSQQNVHFHNLRRNSNDEAKYLVLTLTIAAFFLVGTAFAQSTTPEFGVQTGINAGQPLASVSANANDMAFSMLDCGLRQRAADSYGRQSRPGTTVQSGRVRWMPLSAGPGGTSPVNVFPGWDPTAEPSHC